MPISVLIPCFNAGEKVLRAIASAIPQHGVDEVIVLDDGSTDGTRRFLERAGALPKVKIIARDENKGAQYTRNQLVLVSASGDNRWLTFLDADDEIIGNEESLIARTSNIAAITYCNMLIERYEQGAYQYRQPWNTSSHSLLYSLAAFEFVPSTSALLLDRNVFQHVSWNETATYSGGMHCFQILLDALKAGIAIAHVPIEGILYREGWSPNQISGNKNRLNRLFARYFWQKSLIDWLRSQEGDYEEAIAIGIKKFNEEWQAEIGSVASSAELPNIDNLTWLNV